MHHGHIVKRTGDGSIIEFRSVVDAVRCAIEVQNAMVERNAGVPEDRRIVFRIGIHLGDVVEESDGDLMGDGVNIAARLEGIAKPGAICLSEDAYRQVSGRLDMEVTDLGPTQLKNIERPIRAYSLQVGVPAQAKPTKAAEPVTPQRSRRRKDVRARAARRGIAALLVVIAGGAWWFLDANRPASVATNTPAEAAPFHRRAALRQSLRRSGARLSRRRAHRRTDHCLARIPGNFVIARNTAFTFKGKPVDAKAIGKDLGVRYVLEGSVQPSGNQVRVNAQLIDADSGAHLWAEQFDTARADLLQMQDEIVTHLARSMQLQLTEAEGARLKRTPAANPNAEDLALQCVAGLRKGGYIGKEADAAYGLCEQALAIDPDNTLATNFLNIRTWLPAALGLIADRKADLQRADEVVSRMLARDPNDHYALSSKGHILQNQAHDDDAIAEHERSLALDPADADTFVGLAFDYLLLGQFEKSLEFFDRTIRLSPLDPALLLWYGGKSSAYFGLKQYDQAIDLARRSIAINPNYVPDAHANLVAALALSGREAEAREALQRYLALTASGKLRTIAAWRAYYEARVDEHHKDPRVLDSHDRAIEGLRKAGMPEE